MANFLYQNDIPSNIELGDIIAIDTETKGLNIYQRDRLCLIQISGGDGNAHLIQFKNKDYSAAHNLKKLLCDEQKTKIFHFARFDIAALKIFLNIDVTNIFCTKIASRLSRTYTDKHGLKDLVKEVLDIDLSKQAPCSDWSGLLSDKQLDYAASDVLHLHKLKSRLEAMLADENRLELAKKIFNFLPSRVELDILGWGNEDIFAH